MSKHIRTPEREDRDADREKGEEWGAGSAPWGKCTVVAGKTELEAEQSCITWYSQQGHILHDNDESKGEVI